MYFNKKYIKASILCLNGHGNNSIINLYTSYVNGTGVQLYLVISKKKITAMISSMIMYLDEFVKIVRRRSYGWNMN